MVGEMSPVVAATAMGYLVSITWVSGLCRSNTLWVQGGPQPPYLGIWATCTHLARPPIGCEAQAGARAGLMAQHR